MILDMVKNEHSGIFYSVSYEEVKTKLLITSV